MLMETLLDLRALDPVFEPVFGDRAVRQLWFQQMLQLVSVSIATNACRDFGQIGRAALDMTAQRRRLELSPDEQQRILGAVRELPPQSDCV